MLLAKKIKPALHAQLKSKFQPAQNFPNSFSLTCEGTVVPNFAENGIFVLWPVFFFSHFSYFQISIFDKIFLYHQKSAVVLSSNSRFCSRDEIL